MNQQGNSLLLVLTIAGILYYAKNQPATPSPAPAAPSAELQTLVAPVRTALAGHQDRQKIAAFFRECAVEVRANQQLATVEHIRLFNEKAGAAVVRRVGNVTGLGGILNQGLKSITGDDPIAVDPVMRERIALWYEAVAWAAGG